MTWHTNNSEPSTSSPEQEAAFSLTSYLDTLQLEPAKSKNIPETSCSPDSGTESFPASRSGMTSARSTVGPGKGKSMSSAAASPAKTLAPQGKALVLLASEAAYGVRWHASFVKYDHDLHLWKTHQCSLLEDYIEFSETWPKWGMMRDGVCSERVTPAHLTSAIESGFLRSWQTPVSDDSVNRAKGKINSRGEPKLSAQVKQFPTPYGLSANQGQGDGEFGKAVRNWPTPLCMDSLPPKSEKALLNEATNARPGRSRPANLRDCVHPEQLKRWATPQASDNRDRGCMEDASIVRRIKIGKQIGLSTQVKQKKQAGTLSPMWVEWLMGWPIGWTDLKPLETGKFRNVQLWHGVFYPKD